MRGDPIVLVGALLLFLGALIIFCTAAFDLYFELKWKAPVGQRLQRWAEGYPFLAGGLVLVLGALLSHFYWQAHP